jgi:hypothetical protein
MGVILDVFDHLSINFKVKGISAYTQTLITNWHAPTILPRGDTDVAAAAMQKIKSSASRTNSVLSRLNSNLTSNCTSQIITVEECLLI